MRQSVPVTQGFSSVAVDHVALDVLREKSIRLGYTPSALTDAVADLTVMLTLMAQRRGGEVCSGEQQKARLACAHIY